MREIKFRALTLEGNLLEFYLHESSNVNDGVFYVDNVPYEAGTEQQYTGLKDKTGREIYENDIVKLGDELTLVVEWVENGYWNIGDFWGAKFGPHQGNLEIIGTLPWRHCWECGKQL